MDNDEIINQRHSRLLGKEHWFHKDNVKEMLNEARADELAKIVEMLEKLPKEEKWLGHKKGNISPAINRAIQKIKEMP